MTIYSMTKKRVSPEINAISTLLFGAVLLLLIIINVRESRRSACGSEPAHDYRSHGLRVLRYAFKSTLEE